MKKIWTSVAILASVFVAAGIICGVVSYLNGGSVGTLLAENRQAAFTLQWLSPVTLIPYLLGV